MLILIVACLLNRGNAVCADAVRSNRLTQTASADEVERVVREWLRTATDRSGGRRRREAGRRQSAPSEAPATAAAALESSDEEEP